MNKIVRAHGPANANIALVTDYPDKQELIAGEVLSGYSRYYIRNIFETTSIRDTDIYYTSVFKEALEPPLPKGNKDPLGFIEKSRDTKSDIKLLTEELLQVKPNVIVPLGDVALKVITGHYGNRKLAGSIIRPRNGFGISHFTKIIPFLHPRQIRQDYRQIFPSSVYAGRVAKYANVKEFPEKDWTVRVIRNATELGEYFKKNKNAKIKVTDVETYLCFITCIGFCCDGREGISVPLLEKKITDLEHSLMYRQITDFLQEGDYVNQNIGFDVNQLENHGFHIKNVIGDTMIMAGTLFPELDKNLGFLNSQYTEIPYFKDEGKEWNPKYNDKLYEYNAKDCIATWRIWHEQIKEAKELNLLGFYQKGPQKFYPMYKRMENYGLQIDEEARTSLRTKYTEMATDYTYSIETFAGKNFNPRSTNQCCELLYGEYKLPIQKKKRANGNKTPTADADALEYLALNHATDDPLVRGLLYNIITVRKIDKILDYINSVAHPDGRMRFRYKIAGTESGRTSTSQCDDYRWYLNKKDEKLDKHKYGISIQQFPKHGYELITGETIGNDLRGMFVASPGHVLIEWDQKQAEAVVVGAIGRDMDMLRIIETGDLHTWTAALVTGKLQVEVTKRERQVQGKKTRHGGHYDMTFKTLAAQAKISEIDAKIALLKFHAKSPNIRGVYQAEVAKAINETRCLITPHGRRRDFLARIDNNCLREGYSYVPQAVVSDNQKFGMLRIKDKCPDIEFLMEAHDGTLAEIPIGTESKHFETIKEIMEQPTKFDSGTFIRDPVIIRCELGISKGSWNDMEEIKL